MNPLDLFNQVKELIENKDFSAENHLLRKTRTNSVTTLAKRKHWFQAQKGLTVL